jgi:hypothetical protein
VARPAARLPRWLAPLAALVTVAGAALWWAGRGGGTAAVAAIDAGVVDPAPLELAAVATLDVDSRPSGATGRVESPAGTIEIPATPARVEVPAGATLTVHLELAGHRPWRDDRVQAERGQVVLIRATLARARAALHVETEPPGAQVTLGGRLIGETPLRREDLDPGSGLPLVIQRPGYAAVRTTIDLQLERPVTVHEKLVAVQRFGTINLHVEDSWAKVYLGKKYLGESGPGLRLPVGRHRLELVNPPSGKRMTLVVEVDEHETHYYSARFP